MEKIIVDPKVFVTCRLCLDNMGFYQITPVFQSQIKYCFDIDVDPFDSMPQLICGECETVLTNYVTIKRTFVGKQNALRARREVQKGLQNQSTQQGIVSSSQENVGCRETKPRVRKSKIDFTGSITSSATEDMHSRSSSPTAKKKKKLHKKRRHALWEDNYNKSYVCRICIDKTFVNECNVKRHLKSVHRQTLAQYKALFIGSCTVQMEKVDKKPNHINSLKVVLKPQKIVADTGKIAYHVVYTPLKGLEPDTNHDNESVKTQHTTIASDSSDDEILPKHPRSKRRRLSSESSNNTVCLDNAVDVEPEEAESAARSDVEVIANDSDKETKLVNVDGFSDSDHDSNMSAIEASSSIDPKSIRVSVIDYKTIHRIISTCQQKYMKRVAGQEIEENTLTNSDMNINNKILNIGRKVINKPGISCKGLLRYIENKNLELEWQPINDVSLSNKESYVRILPKLKGKTDTSDKIGWKFSDSGEITETNTDQCATFSVTAKKQSSNALKVSSCGPTFRVNDLLKEANKGSKEIKVPDTDTNDTRAVLYPISKSKKSDKILLNANPVANPKKPPKKIACPKSAKPKKSTEDTDAKPVYDTIFISNTGVLEADLHMPIITSTTSLAGMGNEVDSEPMNYEASTSEADIVIAEVNSKLMNHQASTSEAEIVITAVDSKQINHQASTSEAAIEITSDAASDSKQNTSKTDVSSSINAVPMSVIVHADTSKNNGVASINNMPPRIKVKPVSELMTVTALSSLNQQQEAGANTWDAVTSNQVMSQSNQENCLASMLFTHSQFSMPNMNLIQKNTPANSQVLTISSNNNASNCGTTKPDYMILDTVQFPNTKTYSPIKYVQNLLQTHNIILLDTTDSITPDFSCLINFKVQFTQGTAHRTPVILFLSLYSFENQFYLGVRESVKNTIINPHCLSANWQWELIKMYTGRDDVHKKLLLNAEKISQKVYDYTNTLLCLLKSIKVIEGIQ